MSFRSSKRLTTYNFTEFTNLFPCVMYTHKQAIMITDIDFTNIGKFLKYIEE